MKPITFWLHFNRINESRKSDHIWTVHTSKQCIPARKVEVFVPLQTVYKGRTAAQPRAYLKGKGYITVLKTKVKICATPD